MLDLVGNFDRTHTHKNSKKYVMHNDEQKTRKQKSKTSMSIERVAKTERAKQTSNNKDIINNSNNKNNNNNNSRKKNTFQAN